MFLFVPDTTDRSCGVNQLSELIGGCPVYVPYLPSQHLVSLLPVLPPSVTCPHRVFKLPARAAMEAEAGSKTPWATCPTPFEHSQGAKAGGVLGRVPALLCCERFAPFETAIPNRGSNARQGAQEMSGERKMEWSDKAEIVQMQRGIEGIDSGGRSV